MLPEQPLNPEEQEPVRPRVSAIVVSHNRVALLRRLLESLEHSEGRETIEIIVVDNGSRDGSGSLEAEFPHVCFMRLPRNFGLTKALNIGIRSAHADYLLLLHDDTELAPDAVSLLARTLDAEPEAGGVCPLLVDQEGNPAPQLGSLPPDGTLEPAEAAAEPYAVNYTTGAAFMLRAFFIRAMRQIDERYGQFGSDAELCAKIRGGGKNVMLVPAVRAVHHGREEDSDLREVDMKLGRAAFIGKHIGFFAGLKDRIGIVLGALFKVQFGQLFPLISGQKIDGTQKNA